MVSFLLLVPVAHNAALCICLRGSEMPLFGGFANDSRTIQGFGKSAIRRVLLTAGTLSRIDSALAKTGQGLHQNSKTAGGKVLSDHLAASSHEIH